jgi:hypothetical protein
LSSCVTFYQKNEFNADEWVLTKNERYRMIDNLMNNVTIIGKTRNEISGLLGDFDFVFNDNHIRYYLGFNENSENYFYNLKIIFTGMDVMDLIFENDIVIISAKTSENNYPKIKFDKNIWDEYINARFTMTKDIIKNKVLLGKTKDEVIELLGNEYHNYGNENLLCYYVGFVPQFVSIDPDILMIHFENGIAKKVKQLET